jgi:hypothetical protein
MYHVYLSPGANQVGFRGIVDFLTILKNIRTIYTAQAALLKEGKIVLTVIGTATIYKGVHITYIEEVMNALRLDVPTALRPIVTQTLDGWKQNVLGVATYIFGNFGSYSKGLDLSGVDLSKLAGNATALNVTTLVEDLKDLNFTRIIDVIEGLSV